MTACSFPASRDTHFSLRNLASVASILTSPEFTDYTLPGSIMVRSGLLFGYDLVYITYVNIRLQEVFPLKRREFGC